ncbi:hypothetical protein G6F57_022754 [Rhizopus arrhizus]|nr:hypothetical protein G6F57_022754 [Rhizopus arrhizus]
MSACGFGMSVERLQSSRLHAIKFRQSKMPQRVIFRHSTPECCAIAASYRQRSRGQDLFQHEKGADLAYAGQLDDLARMQLVEAFQITYAQHQKVVEFAGYQMALQTAADAPRGFLEIGE